MEVKDEYPTMTLMYKDEGGSYHVVLIDIRRDESCI